MPVANSCSACAVLIGGLTLGAPPSARANPPDARPLALVYARDPVQTPEPELLELPLLPQGKGLQHPWLAARSCVDAGEVTQLRTAHGEQRLHVCSTTQAARADAQGHFSAKPLAPDATEQTPDAFAEQMLFFHAGRTFQFLAGLGLPPARGSAQLQLIANVRLPGEAALEPWRDATFVRAHADAGPLDAMRVGDRPAIFFGQDHDVRVAYDATAIRHEVAHAVLAAWLPAQAWFVDAQGENPAPAAIAEALADYFAAAQSNDPRLGLHVDPTQSAVQTRNLSAALRCPEDLTGAAHEDGLVLSSALWAARQQLGAALDLAVASGVKSLRAARAPSVELLLTKLVAAIGDKQAAEKASATFRERGLLPGCQRILSLQPRQALSGKFFLPAKAKGLPLASSSLQLQIAVAPGVREIELSMRAAAHPAFDPALLVQSSPIRWIPAGPQQASLVPAADGGRTGELRFVVPTRGAQALYVQLVNRGPEAGWYDGVRVVLRH